MQELPIEEFDVPNVISGTVLSSWKPCLTKALYNVDDNIKTQAYSV